MKKQDTIIRVGDTIQIISPYQFIRVGYPLGIKDLKSESSFVQNTMIQIHQFLTQLGYHSTNRSFSSVPCTVIVDDTTNKIFDILVYEELKKRNFGGNERGIKEEYNQDLKDYKSKVTKIQYIKTGIRQRSKSSKGKYFHVLTDQHTYKVLYLDYLKVLSHRVKKIL